MDWVLHFNWIFFLNHFSIIREITSTLYWRSYLIIRQDYFRQCRQKVCSSTYVFLLIRTWNFVNIHIFLSNVTLCAKKIYMGKSSWKKSGGMKFIKKIQLKKNDQKWKKKFGWTEVFLIFLSWKYAFFPK